jgi:tetratricopeptide (TPR) repeat protein
VALAGGALFAVHPVHVESVAFVSGRTDLLAAVFSMGAVLLWLRARSAEQRNRGWSVAAGGALYLLACLSKEVAFVLPAVLVAWDLLLPSASERWRTRDRFTWLAGFAAALGAVLVLRVAVAGVPSAGGIAGIAGPTPLAQRLALLPSVLLFSLRLLVFPWPLTPYYVPDQVRVGAATVVAAGLLLAVWALLAGRRWKRAGALSAAWALFFLLPTLPLAERGGALVAERFLYLPSAGLSILVVAWCGREMPFRRSVGALFGLATAVVAAVTVGESAIWRDEGTLFSAITRRSPTWADGWVGLAHVREQQGRLDEAATLLNEAFRLDPAHEGAHMKLGMVRGRQGRFDQALTAFQRALELRPDYPDALVNLGQTLLMMRRPIDAIPPLERTVALRPSFASAWTLLGRARGMTGDHAGAGDAFGRAVAIAPADADAWFGLVIAQLRQGRPDLAWEAQRALARIDAEAGQRASALIRAAGG